MDESIQKLIEVQGKVEDAERELEQCRWDRARVVVAARENMTLEGIGNCLGLSKQAVAGILKQRTEEA